MVALQILYELDLTAHDPADALVRAFGEQPAPPPVRAHVERLVRGVLSHQLEIDPLIHAAAPAFPLAQLAAVDRNILRLAIYELMFEPEVPPRVAINEAVELAKHFGGDNSGRFVNGVLGTVGARIASTVRPTDSDRENPVSPGAASPPHG
jgi:N utilization substance protein B